MQFKTLAAAAAVLAFTSALAIPAPNADLATREASQMYQCASTSRRDLQGRCGPKREAEAEPAELYPYISGTKREAASQEYHCASETRDLERRCGPKAKREPGSQEYHCASETRDLERRCGPKREAAPEPVAEPGQLYGCASNTRSLSGRCPSA